MKGIVILAFDEKSNLAIDTQFPINLTEFLKLDANSFDNIGEMHMRKKMEPHLIEMVLGEGLNIRSFYSGFSFRHYVGKPNFAITVFISNDESIPNNFEGMLRRIAHELLPKKEALNFDDILRQYFDMLKKEELLPYWEEIIEGEAKVITKKKKEDKAEEKEGRELDSNSADDRESGEIKPEVSKDGIEINSKNVELQMLLDEKKSKIRELTRKYTELVSENTKISEENQTCKEEISEQYIKLENWSQQMADLNQNNVKLMDEITILNQKITERDDFLKEKEMSIEALTKKLTGIDEVEGEVEKILQEKENLKKIKLGLDSELDKIEKTNKNLLSEIDKLKSQITIHLDSITSLKVEIKNMKSNILTKEKEKDNLKEQIFDLKKEVKILRRERDHYRKIVKEKNLLE